jgi:hypothetical protein
MTLIETSCSFCHKKYLRLKRRVNEAKKFRWKQYCSPKCLSLGRNKQKTLKCGNPKCQKTFKKIPSEITPSGICFCSRTCSAIFNNPKSPKRRPKIRICPICKKKFTGKRKYCSRSCQPKPLKLPEKQIIKDIKEFYKDNGRIPVKREYYHYKAARLRFGTWNKAIEAAGFNPHSVLFAKKYVANDGHQCDSLSEKIIDDWLTSKKIIHQKNVYYLDSKYTADFKVNDIFIEFFGLCGVRKYDKNLTRKLKFIKNNQFKIIKIYPQDIFPKFRIHYLLDNLIKLKNE